MRSVLLTVLAAAQFAACASPPVPPSSRSLTTVLPDRLDELVFEDMGSDFPTLDPVIRRAGGEPATAEVVGRVADDSETSVVGVRVPGVAGPALADAFVAERRDVVERDDLGPIEVHAGQVDGKQVSKLMTPHQTLYVWASADTMFYATAVDDVAARELLRVLPPE